MITKTLNDRTRHPGKAFLTSLFAYSGLHRADQVVQGRVAGQIDALKVVSQQLGYKLKYGRFANARRCSRNQLQMHPLSKPNFVLASGAMGTWCEQKTSVPPSKSSGTLASIADITRAMFEIKVAIGTN